MFANRSTRPHGLKAWHLAILGFLTASVHAATKVAVIDAGVDPPGQFWCSFLIDNGFECTLFPATGPTTSLDEFAVVIDMSDEWADSGHLLAQVMQSGRGVITWGSAPDVLGLESDPLVRAWIGANDATFGSDMIKTVTADSMLVGISPGTIIGNSGKFGSRALNNIVGHDQAKVLARHGGGTSSIALLRNRWTGQSVYISDGLILDEVVGQILLRAVNELSVRTVPASSTWGLMILGLIITITGSILVGRRRQRHRSSAGLILVVMFFVSSLGISRAQNLTISGSPGELRLHLNDQPPFYSTNWTIQNARAFVIADSIVVALWDEVRDAQQIFSMYALFPGGQSPARIADASYVLRLPLVNFDPLVGQPAIAESLRSDESEQLFIIQFHVQLVSQIRTILSQNGVELFDSLGTNAVVGRINAADMAGVVAFPFVRSVTPFHPALRTEKRLYSELTSAFNAVPVRRYYLLLVDNQEETSNAVANTLVALGAEVLQSCLPTRRIEFRGGASQLREVLRKPQVLFVDFPGGPGVDMDRARDIGGATQVPSFTGGPLTSGVRGEVMDAGFQNQHVAFQSGSTPLIHSFAGSTGAHGTSAYGIIFGDGTGDSCPSGGPCGSGILPDAHGIYLSYGNFYDDPPTASRYVYASQLVRPNDCGNDQQCPYNAVFQTNSWGHSHRLEYTTISQELDQIVFDFDLLVCQSQANCGRSTPDLCDSTDPDSLCTAEPTCSRPQAWSKNVLSIGSLFDFPDETNNDHRNDRWCPADPGEESVISCTNPRCGSRGPSADKRVKPDLVHYGDCIRTPSVTFPVIDDYYTSVFGGTSAATPITCGYAGLVFQMWHEEVFKVWNGTTSVSTGGGASVFADRPHASTVKAMLINTAYRYPLVTEPPNYRPDFTRDNMGWGIVDIAALYEQRETMFIVNETDLLTEFQTKSYTYNVPSGRPALRVTLVYTDPPGIPNSTANLVNDVSLKVVSPSGTVYWGNFGLIDYCGLACSDNYVIPFVGNWSLADSDTLDTEKDHKNNVENVFIKNPAAGNWTITVIADAIIEDGHVETATVDDVDYALVISSAERPRGRCCQTNCTPSYHCDCSWTSKTDCTGTGKVWSSEATCADDCGSTCPNICIE